MDKSSTQRTLDCCSMQVAGTSSLQLLLPTSRDKRIRSHAAEAYRRDLYRVPVLRISSNDSEPSKRRPQCESETNSESHEETRLGRTATRAEYLEKSSRTPQVSVPAERPSNHQTFAGVELGYHLHPIATGFCIPCGSDRLVQSTGTFSSSIKLSRGQLLHRGFRGGRRKLRSTRNLQHRLSSDIRK